MPMSQPGSTDERQELRHQATPTVTAGPSSTTGTNATGRLPIPRRSEWNESCVPWRYLLIRFGARVHRRRVIGRLPWHLLFLALQLAAAFTFQHIEQNSNVTAMLHEVVGGPASVVFAPGFHVKLNSDERDGDRNVTSVDQVMLSPLLGPGLVLDTIQTWRQWQVLVATVVGEGWCASRPGTADEAAHSALCTSPTFVRVKDADEYETNCLGLDIMNQDQVISSGR
jgi:hypothetical protein